MVSYPSTWTGPAQGNRITAARLPVRWAVGDMIQARPVRVRDGSFLGAGGAVATIVRRAFAQTTGLAWLSVSVGAWYGRHAGPGPHARSSRIRLDLPSQAREQRAEAELIGDVGIEVG